MGLVIDSKYTRKFNSLHPSFCLVCAQDLSSANYVQRFDALLFLEEVQNEMEMQQFDMQSVRFAIRGPYLALDVPGIAEGRPSLLLGDAVSATVAGKGARL